MLTDWQKLYGYVRSMVIYRSIPGRQKRMRNLYRHFLRPGELAFDIGSHLGNRVDAWTRLGAKVVAIEPQGVFFKHISKRFKNNPNVTVLRQGVSASPGMGKLRVSDRTPTLSSFADDWRAFVTKSDKRFSSIVWNREEDVPLTTLDDLINQYGTPAFCKIDVEGSEHSVLMGLSRPIPALSFEYIPIARDQALACIERLERLAKYEYNWSVRETMKFGSNQWQSAHELRSVLLNLPDFGSSGDVYARLAP